MHTPRINWTGDKNPFSGDVIDLFVEWIKYANQPQYKIEAKILFKKLTQVNRFARVWDLTNDLSKPMEK